MFSGILRPLNVKCFCFEEIILCIEAFTSIEPKNPPNIIILQTEILKYQMPNALIPIFDINQHSPNFPDLQ